MGFHFRREKEELSIPLTFRNDQVIPLQGSNMMLGDTVVNVESLREAVDIVGFSS